MSKMHKIKEMIELMVQELEAHNVSQYDTVKTPRGHVIISFMHNGRPRSVTISGSTDPMARLRNRSIIRQILEGRR